MKNLLLIAIWSTVVLMVVSGCGGLGGQGFSVKIVAENGSTIKSVTIDFNADDGGTDLPGILYRPDVTVDKLSVSDISVDKSRRKTTEQPTTQPSE